MWRPFYEHDFDLGLEDIPEGLPMHAGGFHGHVSDTAVSQPVCRKRPTVRVPDVADRMRILKLIVALVLVSAMGLYGEASPVLEHSLLNGLRWYFHWMHPLPVNADAVTCRGVELNDSDFAYCNPGSITLEVSNSPRSVPNVEFVGPTTDDYPKAVNWFRELHGARVSRSFQMSLGMADISAYAIVEERSRAWMEAARVFLASTVRGHGNHQVRLFFPLISTGDPAYQVYLTADAQVESIWEVRVIDGTLQDYNRWVYDEPHHNIPVAARAFVEDPKRWYRILAEDQLK